MAHARLSAWSNETGEKQSSLRRCIEIDEVTKETIQHHQTISLKCFRSEEFPFAEHKNSKQIFVRFSSLYSFSGDHWLWRRWRHTKIQRWNTSGTVAIAYADTGAWLG